MRLFLAGIVWAGCTPVPAVPVVSLEPSEPDTSVDLLASVAGESGVTWAWYRDDQWVPEIVGPRVPASLTNRGEIWRAEATDWRGKTPVTGVASVTVRNAAPWVAGALAPEAPEAGDPLVVAALAFDHDEDEVTVTFSWSRDGKPVSGLDGSRVPPGLTRRGEAWSVTATANDGYAKSQPLVLSATVSNGIPEVTGGGLTPLEPRVGDTLTATAQVLDPDGDPVQVEYRWYVAEVLVQAGEKATLAPGPFRKGQVVRAAVALDDGLGGVTVSTLGQVVVQNTAPSPPTLAISPEEPVAGEALRCVVVHPGSDADADPTSVSLAWTVDDTAFSGVSSSVLPGDTVPAGVTRGEERWRCQGRASDGEAASTASAAEVEVLFDGFRASQSVAGRTVTCAKVTHGATWSECEGLRVDGKSFPNGVDCFARWSSTSSPHTDHAGFCELITGSRTFQADYTCGATESRVTFVGGAWGSRTDNGYSQSLRCGW